jgi:hypothetical protein
VVACLGFALFARPALMPLWIAIYGVQLGATGACSRATAAGLIAADRRGLGMGVVNACEGAGLLVASVVGGVLWEQLHSGAAPFFYGDAAALVGAIVVYWALKPPAAPESTAPAAGEGDAGG